MDSTHPETHQPWYWKVFSGLIIAVTTVLLGTVFNTLYGSMQQYRTDVQETQRKIWAEVKEIKAEISLLKSDISALKEKTIQAERATTAFASQVKDQERSGLDLRERIIKLEAIKAAEARK
jgi:uncharacterized protein YlxW (UPF0749 family)